MHQIRAVIVGFLGFAVASACTSEPAGPGPGGVPCTAGGSDITLNVGAYASIETTGDSACVRFSANASASDSAEYVIMPWSVGGNLGSTAPFTVESAEPPLTTPSLAARLPLPRMPRGARGPIAIQFDRHLRQLARARGYSAILPNASVPVGEIPASPLPPVPPVVGSLRSFKVCSNQMCSAYETVGAVAQEVGEHIAIFVDTLAPSPGLSATALDSLQKVFDTQLYPSDTATFGGVSDIDGNSVIIVLMTGTVNHLVTKSECMSGGFVSGFFFSGDLDPVYAPQFNDGEIFYSIVPDPSATLSCAHSVTEVERFMPVTFVHEFQHMISFVQHVRIRNGDPEESWLDEGMSRYAEEVAGRRLQAAGDNGAFSRFAIDPIFDAYLYLSETGQSPLLFAADTGGLAPLGAGWLFVRYIVDQFGDSLPRRLVQSSQTGPANVAARTGQAFDVTVTRWAIANWVSDLPGFTAPPELRYTSWHFRTTFASLHSQDPTDFPAAYPLVPPVFATNTIDLTGTLKAGSGEYGRVTQPPNGAAFSVHFTAGSAVAPRLNVIRVR